MLVGLNGYHAEPMAEAGASSKAVIAALAANSVVSVLKLGAFLLSGSGSMLSEAIHSFADTGNQLLLFIGLRRAARRSDREYHYGYGAERFVFGILSAAGIFFVGCGVTVYHGLRGLFEPHTPSITATTFVVLGVSAVVEASALAYALRTSLREAKRTRTPYLRWLREKADPATLAVLLEDGVAVLGLVLASASISATYVTGNPAWDAVGSIVVGVLLGLVAVFLVVENRALLLGRAAPAMVEARFSEVLRARRSVCFVSDVKSRQLTPEEYVLKAEIAFDEDWVAERLESMAAASVETSGPPSRVALRAIAAAVVRIVADEIDELEKAVRAEIPEARHIDLEVDRRRRPESIVAAPRAV
jgi:solute carrier family 30 (zinc transporter), member 9